MSCACIGDFIIIYQYVIAISRKEKVGYCRERDRETDDLLMAIEPVEVLTNKGSDPVICPHFCISWASSLAA